MPKTKGNPLLLSGRMVITAAAQERIPSEEWMAALGRHISGDWGDVPPEDAAENDLALKRGFRILSAYGQGEHRFWIITEADRSVTTILLPEDY